MPEKIMRSLREESGILGTSYEWLRQQCIAGKIPHVRVGKGKNAKYLINHKELMKMLETEGTRKE
ncbi:MAG: hypothetical protein E7190_07355 [Erysipelotrichaceae bacterium]|nr:hypothetical protein [Erysipelotrichaceae bacterium]